MKKSLVLIALFVFSISSPAQLRVITSTAIIADVVTRIGGDHVQIEILVPAEADPHNFSPTPSDAGKLAAADVIFLNGLDLESALLPLVHNAAGTDKIVELSSGISARTLAEDNDHGHENGLDPHVWTDPNSIMIWADNIANALAQRDPPHVADYSANSASYKTELAELDAWIREQVSLISPVARKLVTDHHAFGYFAARYGFEEIGAIIPGFSTLSEPSARELATVEDRITEQKIKAIFVSSTVNPALADRVARDTNIRVVQLYSGSIGPAKSYIEYMRNNVNAIVEALK